MKAKTEKDFHRRTPTDIYYSQALRRLHPPAPAKETGIVLMQCITARLSMVGTNQFRSVVLRPNAPQLDYQLDRAERHGVSIKRFALSTLVIVLDDGVLPLKASSRFFFGRFEAGSSASDRALPAAVTWAKVKEINQILRLDIMFECRHCCTRGHGFASTTTHHLSSILHAVTVPAAPGPAGAGAHHRW